MSAPFSEIVSAIEAHAEPLPAIEDDAFARQFDRYADARVVLLGEATHGTSEFYRARAAIAHRLVTEHGFSVLALEADWPDVAVLDARIRAGKAHPGGADAFTRFPNWMWRNREFDAFLEGIAEVNEARPLSDRLEFRGLDVYSLQRSIGAVLDYLDENDPEAAALARKRYGCLTPWHGRPEWYGRAVLRGESDPCEDAVTAQLADLLADEIDPDGTEAESRFDAEQNARIVLAAEQYYRTMYRGSTASWNLRDRHMFDTLCRILERRGPGTKAVIWAHNSHIGDASATEMGWQGQFNIGELCRKRFGDDAALIGFGTNRGTVLAADDWDGAATVKTVRPALADSYEHAFTLAGHGAALLDCRALPQHAWKTLSGPLLERAIGVIYRPETERESHYFRAVLPDQFDGYVWFEETGAVEAHGSGTHPEVPETFPSGL